jgi:CRP/FNR family transcriptional regulator, cyclic AMP receptor protein
MELEKYSLFKGLTTEQISKFNLVIKRKKVKEGVQIIKEGDIGDSIIFLFSGSVKICKPMTLVTSNSDFDDREKEMISLDSSMYPFFGDYSLFTDNNKRTASIGSTSDVEIGILMATDFFNICEEDFQLGYTVIKNLTQNITTQVVKQSDDILKLTTAISLILES